MSNDDLSHLKRLAYTTLKKTVTNEGIYASTALGAEGLFHGFFGRDTAITAYLVSQAEHIDNSNFFLLNAVKGLTRLMQWQSLKDDPHTGEEFGKLPHEVRLEEADYIHLTQGKIQQGFKSWYVDPRDRALKNWDTNDATQLWIIVLARLYEKKMFALDKTTRSVLKNALIWCVRNLNENDGFAGYRFNPDRKWGGLVNHTWKDSKGAYLLENGERPAHPIKDIFGSSLTWCALQYGYKIFNTYDHDFSLHLKYEAAQLKKRFNDLHNGFLMKDTKTDIYYAEAMDENGQQLQAVTCDPGLALWAYCDGESVIENKYIPTIVKRLMMDDLFDPEAGIRTYSCHSKVFDPIGYHRGPHTFWPFVAGLIADGFNHFGYKYESKRLLTAMTKGVKQFGSCVELFIKDGQTYRRFKHPYTDQMSCSDQAWTAAAVYYAANFLQNDI